ncbi:TetR/AcrR family transcriptional regulator [Trinickia mobilis]|uniref:TetR/AcrR family transcriptional regulator n=1 Tax=Trinickia mobilis TaxID=2816356 RepID=UPI001A8FE012|nr:TetR/AcrR family transcriptional regulator [Trinickia mobilis]
MVRPREFDEENVLDIAMQCFWDRGFGTTSVRDLADQMGITQTSLYNTFGDKRALYARALEYYLAQGNRARIKRVEELTPTEAIEEFFKGIVEDSIADKALRGCMLVNTGLEIAPHDPEFRKLVAREFTFIEDFFRSHVEAGQTSGAIRQDVSAGQLAKMLLSVLLGLRVLARSRPQRAVLDGAVQAALAVMHI